MGGTAHDGVGERLLGDGGEMGARPRSVRPSTHSSIRSSRARPASFRRSWIARWSSRASPSARRSSVSSVSITTTSPSSWATAVPGRGRGEDLDLVRGEGDPAEGHGAVGVVLDVRSRGRRP